MNMELNEIDAIGIADEFIKRFGFVYEPKVDKECAQNAIFIKDKDTGVVHLVPFKYNPNTQTEETAEDYYNPALLFLTNQIPYLFGEWMLEFENVIGFKHNPDMCYNEKESESLRKSLKHMDWKWRAACDILHKSYNVDWESCDKLYKLFYITVANLQKKLGSGKTFDKNYNLVPIEENKEGSHG